MRAFLPILPLLLAAGGLADHAPLFPHAGAPLVHHAAAAAPFGHFGAAPHAIHAGAPLVHHAAPLVHHAPAPYAPAPLVHHAPAPYAPAPYHEEPPKDYAFGFEVNDYDAYGQPNHHSRQEAREGNTVKGQYRVELPDCRTQIVDYYVDEYKQYHADVKYEGAICPDKSLLKHVDAHHPVAAVHHAAPLLAHPTPHHAALVAHPAPHHAALVAHPAAHHAGLVAHPAPLVAHPGTPFFG